MNLTIRALGPSDLPDLLTLYTHLHERDEPLPEQSAIDAVWKEILANPRIRYFGVFADLSLISSCTIAIIPNLTRACRPYGLIENVVTRADLRGHGHGKAMLGAALEFAWSQDCYKVMLMTGRKDEATLNFYRAAGFDGDAKRAFIAAPPTT